jgi:hypothetical protein
MELMRAALIREAKSCLIYAILINSALNIFAAHYTGESLYGMGGTP